MGGSEVLFSGAKEEQQDVEVSRNAIKTGLTDRLQPWQALFGILTLVVTQFDISDDKVLILCGILAATLGFTQITNYKHKEAIKEVVAPWLIQRLLEILGEYIPDLPVKPSDIIEPIVGEGLDMSERLEVLKERLAALEAEANDG
jgi:hypothetical protein